MNAFEECYDLSRADFSRVNDTIVVGREAFINCESLVTVDIPQKLIFVQTKTFKNCKSLTTVDFSGTDSMTCITYNAFEGCSALPILDLSSLKHLHSIEGNAFLNNTSLTHIIFPPEFGDFSRSMPNFAEIAGTAFGNCSSLISIVNPQPIPQKAHPSAFNGVDKVACDVFVADSVLADYIAAPVWCDFFYSNLVVQPYDSNHGSTQGGGVFAFFAQDTLVATAKPGYAFVYWSNKEDSILSYNDTLIYTMKYNDSVTAHFRDLSDGDATLLNITPSAGTLSPVFTSQQFHYTDTVRYAVDSIRFSVVINSLGATVNGNDTLMRALNVGHNGCTITVTSRDGYVRETYRIDVYRLNNNAYLHDLQLQGHGITPVFDSLNYRYMAQVPATTTAITLLSTLSDPKGEVVGSFTNRPITIGSNRFDVPVRAEDWDTMRTYTVLVEREKYPPVEETQVLQINVNGRDLLSAPVYSYSGQYSGGCGESQFTITITPAQEGVLDVPNPFTITIDALAGFDTLRFHVTSADGSMISAHQLILEKRFDFDEVIETMWDDNSFMLDISLLNEHGIAVSYDSPYRWYKGGNPIPGGFLPTLSAGPSASDRFEYGVPYYLTMQTEDSVVLRTCEKVLTEKSASMPGVYPNPVVTNQPFTLSLERVGGVVEVYSAHGAHLTTRLVQEEQLTLTLPEKGVYLVKHLIDGEVCGVFKVIVK